VDDPAQYAPVVNPLHPPHTGRQKRRDPRPLLVRNQKKSDIANASSTEPSNHIANPLGTPLVGRTLIALLSFSSAISTILHALEKKQ
jgi:hypothetical protein